MENKVQNKKTLGTYSKKGMTKARAIKQMRALYLKDHDISESQVRLSPYNSLRVDDLLGEILRRKADPYRPCTPSDPKGEHRASKMSPKMTNSLKPLY